MLFLGLVKIKGEISGVVHLTASIMSTRKKIGSLPITRETVCWVVRITVPFITQTPMAKAISEENKALPPFIQSRYNYRNIRILYMSPTYTSEIKPLNLDI